jgi:hypothetical protein
MITPPTAICTVGTSLIPNPERAKDHAALFESWRHRSLDRLAMQFSHLPGNARLCGAAKPGDSMTVVVASVTSREAGFRFPEAGAARSRENRKGKR